MSSNTIRTYLDESQGPYLFCPGCGHGKILDSLNQALVNLDIDPHQLVIVTDIGCAGLSDKYLLTNSFHGLHGRSVTYATGIKLSDPDLHVIVLIGDGGCGIGGHHLLNAARRNIGVTTIVFNNLNYGMTGGEHSVTTPSGSHTATTPLGQLEHPLDICGTVIANGASFVARTTTFDHSLPDLLTSAIKNDGFSLVDIWELCTAHFVPNNHFSKKELYRTLETLSFPTGILVDLSKPEYSTAYRKAYQATLGQTSGVVKPILTTHSHKIKGPVRLILAGAAGGKIGSAASLFTQAAVLAGLYTSQRNDYPVTVKSGHSIAEIIISPEPVKYASIDNPDLVIALFSEGLTKTKQTIAGLEATHTLMISADLKDYQTSAMVLPIHFEGHKKEYRAIMALVVALNQFDYFPLDALKEAILSNPKYAEENMVAYNAGMSLC